MKRFLTAHATALLLVLGAVTAAPADMTSPSLLQWTYSFTPQVRGTSDVLSAVIADPKPGGGVGGVTFTRSDPAPPMSPPAPPTSSPPTSASSARRRRATPTR